MCATKWRLDHINWSIHCNRDDWKSCLSSILWSRQRKLFTAKGMRYGLNVLRNKRICFGWRMKLNEWWPLWMPRGSDSRGGRSEKCSWLRKCWEWVINKKQMSRHFTSQQMTSFLSSAHETQILWLWHTKTSHKWFFFQCFVTSFNLRHAMYAG